LEPKSRVIAIFNTNSEVLELVRESLQQAGFQAVIAHIDDLKRGRLDMIQFVEEHKPDVIVYDVAPPYDTNWTFLRLMRNSKVMQERAFVVTTTNKRALEELIGPNDVVELLCKPPRSRSRSRRRPPDHSFGRIFSSSRSPSARLGATSSRRTAGTSDSATISAPSGSSLTTPLCP